MFRSILGDSARIVLPLAILGVGVVGFVALGQRQPPPPRNNPEQPPELVETHDVEKHEGPLPIETTGEVVPYRLVQLAAEVSGQITFKNKDARGGELVTKGTVLVKIDPRTYELEANRLAKELEQAKSDFDQLNVEEANNEKLIKLADDLVKSYQGQLQRIRSIRVRDPNAISEKDFDKATQDDINARNTLLTLENQQRLFRTKRTRLASAIELVKAKLDQAKLDLERTTVKTPISGMIVRSDIEEMSYMQKGTEVAVIYDTSKVEIKCNVLLEEMAWIWQQKIKPAADGNDSAMRKYFQVPETDVDAILNVIGHRFEWKGKLLRFEGTGLDEKTRTVPLRIRVDNPEKAIRIKNPKQPNAGFVRLPVLMRGMHVKVRINARPPIEFVQVPEKALRSGDVVWRIIQGKNGPVLDIVPVRPAVILDGNAIIPALESGLRPGDRVVVSPLEVTWQAMPVRLASNKKEAGN